MARLSKRRDEVVHKGNLKLASRLKLGALEGRSFRLSMGSPDLLVDRDEVMRTYLVGPDVVGLLNNDELQTPWRVSRMEDSRP